MTQAIKHGVGFKIIQLLMFSLNYVHSPTPPHPDLPPGHCQFGVPCGEGVGGQFEILEILID